MPRRVFDLLVSLAGAVLVVVLLVAGGLLMWGASFAESNVHSQLARQEIYFPPAAAFAHAKPGTEFTPGMIPYLKPYAGKELLTGPEAEAYADHFIAVHLYEMPYHGVYAKISAAARAEPNNPALKALEQVSFLGTTLQGLLLEAYAFATIGEVMFWGSIASFVLAFVLAVLVALGIRHAGRVPPTERVFDATS